MVVGRERLGVMEGRGLRGPFCWAVSMWRGAARIAPVHATAGQTTANTEVHRGESPTLRRKLPRRPVKCWAPLGITWTISSKATKLRALREE